MFQQEESHAGGSGACTIVLVLINLDQMLDFLDISY